MMVALRMFVACALVAAGFSGARAETSPYAGMQNRGLKALSEQQIEDLRGGGGMGMGLAGGLKGCPGPGPGLGLPSALDLSEAQRGRTQALFEGCKKRPCRLATRFSRKRRSSTRPSPAAASMTQVYIKSSPTSAGCKASFATRISNITWRCAA